MKMHREFHHIVASCNCRSVSNLIADGLSLSDTSKLMGQADYG